MNADRMGYYKKYKFKNVTHEEFDFLVDTISKLLNYVEVNEAIDWHTIRMTDVGNFDLLAYDYYDNEFLYWTILVPNGIVDPFDKSLIEKNIFVPPINNFGEFYFDNYNEELETIESKDDVKKLGHSNDIILYKEGKPLIQENIIETSFPVRLTYQPMTNHELVFVDGLLLKSSDYAIGNDTNGYYIDSSVSVNSFIRVSYYGLEE